MTTAPERAADTDGIESSVELPKGAQLHGWRRIFFRFRQRRSAMIALCFVVIMLLVAIFAPLLSPHDPNEQFLVDRLQGFSGRYPFGTDDLGRDLLSRMMHGMRTSLVASFVAVSLAFIAGFIIGTTAGYVGRWVDASLMRLVDGMLSIPSFLMAMAIVGVLGAGVRNTTLAMAVVFTPGFSRLIRGQVLATKEDVFIEAAKVAGASHGRIIRRHIVPNAIAPIVVQVLMTMGLALLVEGTLSYLGLSVKPPGTSLGTLLQRGFAYKEKTQRMIILPGMAITALSWAFNVVADGLRDAISRQEIGGSA